MTLIFIPPQAAPQSTNEYMDKGRHALTPAGTAAMKRHLGQPAGAHTFGIPLAELVRRAPQGYRVPFLVKKICTFLEHNGELRIIYKL